MTTIDNAAVQRLAARVRDEVERGDSMAAQFAIGFRNEVVAAGAYGDGVDTSTTFVIFSATKTFVAMALLPHLDSGALELTAPVRAYLPEFAENGKGDVTVLQLLTMQGGFPQAPLGPDDWGTSAGRRRAFARWYLDWPSGTRTEYHPIAAHWVIAELIETLSGRPYADEVHTRVSEPAGAARLLGTPALAPVTIRLAGAIPDRADLVPVFGREDLVPDTTVTPDALLSMNLPLVHAAAIPGGGGITTATDVVRTYQSFLHDRAGAHPRGWLADAIGTVRNASRSHTDGTPANRTIAGVVAGADGYHDHRWQPAARRAFGHNGAGGQLCWVDPESGLSFCFLHDTIQLDPSRDFLRSRELNSLAIAVAQP